MATQRSKKGSEKVLGEGSQKGSEKGACCGFYSKKGVSFLFCPFLSTVPKGSATQSGPFPKKVGNTRVWKPPGYRRRLEGA